MCASHMETGQQKILFAQNRFNVSAFNILRLSSSKTFEQWQDLSYNQTLQTLLSKHERKPDK